MLMTVEDSNGSQTIVRHYLHEWGKQWRRIVRGGYQWQDREGHWHWHIDGYPKTSASHFKDRASFGTNGERIPPEGYSGDGLLVWRAMQSMNEHGRNALLSTYGIRSPDGRTYAATERAEHLGCSLRQFWDHLKFAESHVWGYISAMRD